MVLPYNPVLDSGRIDGVARRERERIATAKSRVEAAARVKAELAAADAATKLARATADAERASAEGAFTRAAERLDALGRHVVTAAIIRSNGETLSVAEELAIPEYSLLTWLRANPKMLAEAELAMALKSAFALPTIPDAVLSSAAKFVAERMDRDKYGAQVKVDHSGEINIAVSNARAEINARLQKIAQSRGEIVIEHQADQPDSTVIVNPGSA